MKYCSGTNGHLNTTNAIYKSNTTFHIPGHVLLIYFSYTFIRRYEAKQRESYDILIGSLYMQYEMHTSHN